MLDLCGGDVSKAMTVLATSSTMGGLLQFVVNPTLGGASDTFGRKKFLAIGPAFNIFSNGFIALFPKNFLAFIILRTLDDAFTTLSGSTTTSAAISDCASGPDLAIAMSKLGSYIGAGCFLGPIIGDTLLGKYGYRAVYASKCLFAIFHLAFNSFCIAETLPAEQRRPMSGFKSPLSFTELFTNGAALRKLSAVGGFQTFTDGKNVNDLEQLWFVDIQMGLQSTTAYIMAYGVAIMASGAAVIPALLRTLGERGFTTFSNFTNFLAHVLWGAIPKPWAMFAALLVAVPGIDAHSNTAVTAMATDVAQGLRTKKYPIGMGRGEYASYFGNLRAITVAVGPMIYGYIYAFGRKLYPAVNLGYFAAAVVGCLIPELIHRTLTRHELALAKAKATS
eukprot:COSAG02_NODE_8063_length_2726_cov_2.042254_1_plen_392_part_00